jgi:uncharacterized protein (DUF1697 family)
VSRYVSLLRGINVGPTNQVSMPELKQVYVDLGFDDVETYIRSGNVVFGSDDPPDVVRHRIESGIVERLGMSIDVVVRTHDELASVVERNPFPDADPKHLHVVFLAEPMPGELTARLAEQDFGSDEYAPDGREVYLHLPNGFGRSRLATRMSALRAPVVGSVRNWRTVTKLSDLSR